MRLSYDPFYTGLLSRGSHVNSLPQSSHQSTLGGLYLLNLLLTLTSGGHRLRDVHREGVLPAAASDIQHPYVS